ncbi:hypothetical protein ABZY68_16700 [Streptomyces sp. NPDC006482]
MNSRTVPIFEIRACGARWSWPRQQVVKDELSLALDDGFAD